MTVEPLADAPLNVGDIFSRSWQLLRRNPIVVAPMLVYAGFVFAMVGLSAAAAFFALHLTPASFLDTNAPSVLSFVFMTFSVIAVASLLAYGYSFAALYGLADRVWAQEAVLVGDGWRAARARAGALFVSSLGLFGLSLGATILAFPTLGVSFLALVVFTMYAFPAAVGGGRNGFAAVGESLRLVRRNLGNSTIACVILIALQYGISFVVTPFVLPLQFSFMTSVDPAHASRALTWPSAWVIALAGVGYLVGIAGSLFVFGFAAIVQTGLYRALRARAERAVGTCVVSPSVVGTTVV